MKKYLFESWNVAFRHHSSDFLHNKEEFSVIKNPFLYWAADPFIVQRGEKYYIFAELYNRITYKGEIRYCVLANDGSIRTRWRRVLKTKTHLSFPNVILSEGEFFMMPESSKSNRLVIYKALAFPRKWVESDVLLTDVKYADSIFLNDQLILTYDNYSRPRQLVLLKKEHLKWQKALAVDDPSIILRPAGNLCNFEDFGTAIPFQDSSNGEYGHSVCFRKISFDGEKLLMEDGYGISPESVVVHGFVSEIVGIHTYNYANQFEVIDIKSKTPNLLSLLGYCIQKLKGVKR